MIHMVGPRNRVKGKTVINTTSRSADDWSRGLSPFFVGPIQTYYKGVMAKNLENLWQYSKVYDRHIENGEPHKAYFEWALRGWLSEEAHRYPMGKGVKPEYSYWDGQKLSYVEARKKIYAPLYARTVEPTDAFKRLKEIYEAEKEIWLWDFDAYDHHKLGMSYEQVINCGTRKMGHCFVLGMLLENQRVWE